MIHETLMALAAADEGTPSRPRSGLAGSIIAGRRRPSAADKPAPEPKPAAKPRRAAAKATPAEGDERPARTRRARTAAAAVEPAVVAEAPAADAETRPKVTRRRRTAAPAATAPEPVAPAVAESATESATAAPRVTRRRRRAGEVSEVPQPVAEPSTAAPVAVPGSAADGTAAEVARLRGLVEAQRVTLAELKAGMLTLAQQIDKSGHRPRLAVFVDVPNLMYGVENGRTVHMGRLLDMLREGRELVRATAYCPISDDPREPVQQQKFVAPFVPYDYRIVTKPLKRFADGSIKGNFDVEMAIDMVRMASRVDIMAVVSGDADFSRAVESVQGEGVHVEVVAFQGSTSLEMRALADRYLQLDRHAEWLVS